MSRDNLSPIDPMRDPESNEQMAEVERHLKKARPRPVELDAFELERLAFATPLRSEDEKSPSRRRRYRAVTLVAGSWVCGVAVGALVMFLAMRQGVSDTSSAPATARGEQDTTIPESSEQSIGASEPSSDEPIGRGSDWSESEAAVLAMTVADRASVHGRGRRNLRVGMYLPGLIAKTPEYMVSMDETLSASSIRDAPLDVSQGPASYPASTSELTREQLMRQLLGESHDSVL